MTSEQKVKAAHPGATCQRCRTPTYAYYLVWTNPPYYRDAARLGEGKTASAAWVNAAKTVKVKETP